MFLSRIQEIRHIGKFHNCKNIAGLSFDKRTVIFGNNGNGKSTFTTILRSLQTNNNNILVGKKTLGSTGSKRIELDFDHEGTKLKAIFENKKWNSVAGNESIRIFDIKFITENVFEGEKINDDHKANLHKVVVGAEGKKYAELISQHTTKKNGAEAKRAEFISKYNSSPHSKAYSLDGFLVLKRDDEIDKKIADKERELQFANQLNKPSELDFPSPDMQRIESALTRTISSSHDEAERSIDSHIKSHTAAPDTALSFLHAGIKQSNDSTCPFCGQDISSVSGLLKAYKDYFNDAYGIAQDELTLAESVIQKWSPEKALELLKKELGEWNTLLAVVEAYESTLEAINTAELVSKWSMLLTAVSKKAKDFNYVPTEEINGAKTALSKIEAALVLYNSAIKEFIEKTKHKSVADITKELSQLKSQKERFTAKWEGFCTDYDKNQTEYNDSKSGRDQAVKDLSSYTQKMFATHQKSINDVLDNIGADFRVTNLSERKDLRKAEGVFCGFDLEFFGKHVVPLTGKEETPHFRNTLSDGDKGSLAFAFFISMLVCDDKLKDSLIVFDDPISSFDAERRRATAEILYNLKNSNNDAPAQLIVLTHESNFLIRLSKEFTDNSVFLKILPDGHDNGIKKSTFARLNVYDEFIKPESFSILENIQACLDGNREIGKDANDDCRIVLEHALETKYYLDLKEDMKQNKSVGGYVETLYGLGRFSLEKKNNVERLLKDLHESHHKVPEVSRAATSGGDMKSILRSTLKVLNEL